MKLIKGFTLFEILLVAAVILILAASSAPFVMRNISWFYDMSAAEAATIDLYNSANAIIANSQEIQNLNIDSGNNLMLGSIKLQENVEWHNNVAPYKLGNLQVVTITSRGGVPQTLRFVVEIPPEGE